MANTRKRDPKVCYAMSSVAGVYSVIRMTPSAFGSPICFDTGLVWANSARSDDDEGYSRLCEECRRLNKDALIDGNLWTAPLGRAYVKYLKGAYTYGK